MPDFGALVILSSDRQIFRYYRVHITTCDLQALSRIKYKLEKVIVKLNIIVSLFIVMLVFNIDGNYDFITSIAVLSSGAFNNRLVEVGI